MSTQPPIRVAIVGGGVAGLSTALALQKFRKEGANLTFTIYEQASKFSEIGAGLAFGPNAQKALAVIGIGDALERASQDTSRNSDLWFVFKVGDAGHPRSGEIITTVRGINASKGAVHRADFLGEMIALVQDGVSLFDHMCLSYTPHAHGVTLHFINRPDAEADVVIASDGINSRLRAHLYGHKGLIVEEQTARYSEWVAWRGLIPVSAFHRTMGNCNHRQILLGLDRHIVHFPVRNGTLINIVGFVRDSERRQLKGRSGPWAEKRPRTEMLEDFRDFATSCRDMLNAGESAIEEPSIWGIFAVPELKTAIDDRIALIGDACHAMTPHQGAGAGQAVEDALFLTALLSDPKVSQSDLSTRKEKINQALTTYERVRHARVLDIQQTSREAGMLYEFQGVDGEGDNLEKIARNLQERMRWIWEWDIESELEKALR